MFSSRHTRVLFALAIGFALVLAACAPSAPPVVTSPTAPIAPATQAAAPQPQPTTPAATTPLYGGTFVVPKWPDLATCNPAISTDVSVTGVMGNIFDSLVRQDAKFELQGELATSWQSSPDGLTLTFKLRDDVKWHDGVKFTSADVKFTFEKALSKLHPRGRTAFGALDRVDTPDDTTAVFHMKEPSAAFMFQISAPESLIIAKHVYENEDIQKGDSATCKKLPIGTGPFKAIEYTPGVQMVVERNKEWWGTKGNFWGKGQPFLDKIIFPFVPDSATRILGFEKGDFHYLATLLFPREEVARFQKTPGRDVLFRCTQQLGTATFYGLNLRREIFKDVRVRQAIAYAIDLDLINQRVYYNTGDITETFVTRDNPWYNPKLPKYSPRDLKKAGELLDQAGFPKKADGTRLEIKVIFDDRPERRDLGLLFQQMMVDAGIKVTLDQGDLNYWSDKTYMKGDYDVTVATLGIGEPGVGAARLFLSNNIGAALYNNSSAYNNAEMDQLWKTFQTNFDVEKRKAAIYRIQELTNIDLPYIFTTSTSYPAGVNTAEFDGYHPDCVKGEVMLRTVWWKKGRPNP